ncbi:sigma-70 family RNA polymerase sigma factor [bacterium]|nr:MAG: sigma-70 family RNA polymerase sigma factor [bacterium]
MGVPGLLDGLFRHEAGRITATLVRIFGPEHLDLAEDVVQEALLKALRTWPYQGVPDVPVAWITQVAKNAALDRLRKQSTLRPLEEGSVEFDERTTIEDSLELLVRCCHPSLSPEAQAAIVLKTLCGFSTVEIARAFLISEPTAAQRIVRAKAKLREERFDRQTCGREELQARMDSVLRCLYLMFNEGYASTDGEDMIRRDLCDDAIRLARWIVHRPDSSPRTCALVALMLFLRARFDARTDAGGAMVPLSEQRSQLWDAKLTGEAFVYFAASIEGDEEGEFHLQAAIAAEHATGSDWHRIVRLYERLASLAPNPVVSLNAAIALGMAHGPDCGLDALVPLENALNESRHFHAARAFFLERAGRTDESRSALKTALERPGSEPERAYLEVWRSRLL